MNSGFSRSVRSSHLSDRNISFLTILLFFAKLKAEKKSKEGKRTRGGGGKVEKNSLLILQLDIIGRRSNQRFLLVLAHAVEVDEGEDAETYAPADNDCDFSGDIAGCI